MSRITMTMAVAGVLLGATILAGDAQAQALTACDSFSRDRNGNIAQGLCYARSNRVFGNREQINSICEQLIRCGGNNDRGDCHLARNVCKGFVDPNCNHGGFDLFGGPWIKNSACRAARNVCAASPNQGELRMCQDIRAQLPNVTTAANATRPATSASSPTGFPTVRFRFPVEDPGLIDVGDSWPHNLMKGPFLMDHDPTPAANRAAFTCKDYANRGSFVGAPFCYRGHQGADYILKGGFSQMDRADSNYVVAAAPGVVIEVVDNLYDRCHASFVTNDIRFFNVDCDGRIPRDASGTYNGNRIVIRHSDGTTSHYWHIKNSSSLVRNGQSVGCGQRIARIGSSGYSSMPHLHFEVHNAAGTAVDPYAGPLSQSTSLWVNQGPMSNRIPAAQCAGSSSIATPQPARDGFTQNSLDGRCAAGRFTRTTDPWAPKRFCDATVGRCGVDGNCQQRTNVCAGVAGSQQWARCENDPDRPFVDLFNGPPIRLGACYGARNQCGAIALPAGPARDLAVRTCLAVAATRFNSCR